GNQANNLAGGLGVYQVEAAVTDSSITDNTGGYGGGIAVDAGILSLESTDVLRNTGRSVGGGLFTYRSQVTVVTSNFGSGSDDNSPNDVVTTSYNIQYADYGVDASFTCDTNTCDPAY